MDVHEAVLRELALLSPAVRRDPLAVDRLLDPHFREVGASGRLWERGDIVELLAHDDDAEISVSELRCVALAGDLVLLTYLSERSGERARRCTVWRRGSDGWRALYHQGTPVPPVPASPD
jgi:hypothetical protein